MYLKIKNIYRQYVSFKSLISRVAFLYIYTRLSWLTWDKTRRYAKSETKKNIRSTNHVDYTWIKLDKKLDLSTVCVILGVGVSDAAHWSRQHCFVSSTHRKIQLIENENIDNWPQLYRSGSIWSSFSIGDFIAPRKNLLWILLSHFMLWCICKMKVKLIL